LKTRKKHILKQMAWCQLVGGVPNSNPSKKNCSKKTLEKTLEKILFVNDKSLCIHMFTLATQHT
jgi:hypothetical protein